MGVGVPVGGFLGCLGDECGADVEAHLEAGWS